MTTALERKINRQISRDNQKGFADMLERYEVDEMGSFKREDGCKCKIGREQSYTTIDVTNCPIHKDGGADDMQMREKLKVRQ
jgi:hypothetical protein